MQSDESTFLASPADVVGFEQWCAAYIRLQPVPPTVAASASYGCSLCFLRLQPLPPTVAASATYGCRCAGFELLTYTQRIEGLLRDHDGLRVCHTP